jgi:hypothetical protein
MSKAKGAKWTRAFINNLPDSAFAVIEPGGKKDADGKTTPRRLRHLPHHNASVKKSTENDSVDLPHLRNALARAPQMKIAQSLRRKAIAHLEAHARELLKTRKEEASDKYAENDVADLGKILAADLLDKDNG